MDVGHGGASGLLKAVALEHAFLFKLEGKIKYTN